MSSPQSPIVPLKRPPRSRTHTSAPQQYQEEHRNQSSRTPKQAVTFDSIWDVYELKDSIITQKPPSLSLKLPNAPLQERCDKFTKEREGVCCKDLKVEERHLINPDVMRDA